MKTNLSIDVNVKLELTESSVNLLRSLFAAAMPTGCCNAAPMPTATVAPEEKPAVEEKAPGAPKAAKAPAEKKPAKPVEEAKAAEVPQSSERKVGIEDVRKALAEKVDGHRATIKQKLTEFGAPNVTKLDPVKYVEMYDFLKSL